VTYAVDAENSVRAIYDMGTNEVGAGCGCFWVLV
jgi:hypothetical protein